MNGMSQDILQNGISSLKEGLLKYKNAIDGNSLDQYKFTILHFSHFIELCLKYYIASLHPLLIYQKPFDKRIENENSRHDANTITIDQALQILKNSGIKINIEFENDIKFLKEIRNQIMHSKFSFNSNEIDEKLGKLAKTFFELDEEIFQIELISWLNEEEYNTFEKLYTNYFEKLKKAKDNVNESKKKAYQGRRTKEYDQIYWTCYICPECKEKTLIPCNESETGYRCAFCGNEESNEIEHGCPVCGDHPTLSIDDEGSERFYCIYHKNQLLGMGE